MDSLRSILPKVLHKRGLHGAATSSHVTFAAEQWLKSALPHLADQIRVTTYRDAVLTVTCAHGIALQECRHLLPLLRDALAKDHAGLRLEDIRLERSGRRGRSG